MTCEEVREIIRVYNFLESIGRIYKNEIFEKEPDGRQVKKEKAKLETGTKAGIVA